jgi:hypothetical protein
MTRTTFGKPGPVFHFFLFPAFLLLGLLLLTLGGCAEPFIVLSGDSLRGEVIDPPPSWKEFSEVQVVQLETSPEDPYSVNIWTAAIGPDIYIATGADPTSWTEHLDINSDVRLRIGEQIYELEASPVTDPAERGRVGAEYVRKYDLDIEGNWVTEGQIFRLDRR